MIAWLEPGEPFPPVENALTEPAGLLAAGGDLRPARLIDAYRHGIFPWYSEGQPILWWSTDPRMVLFTDELRVSHSLKKRLLQLGTPQCSIEVRCDSSFEEVIRACAAPRSNQAGTWISEPMIESYSQLHQMGIAHSVETWVDGELAGGLYGLAIGRMFFGESMFARRTDASKIALACLVELLVGRGFPMIDCQQETAHLASLGARPISRGVFVKRVGELVDAPTIRDWPKVLPEPVATPARAKADR